MMYTYKYLIYTLLKITYFVFNNIYLNIIFKFKSYSKKIKSKNIFSFYKKTRPLLDSYVRIEKLHEILVLTKIKNMLVA